MKRKRLTQEDQTIVDEATEEIRKAKAATVLAQLRIIEVCNRPLYDAFRQKMIQRIDEMIQRIDDILAEHGR
jgi:hypothetical protein